MRISPYMQKKIVYASIKALEIEFLPLLAAK